MYYLRFNNYCALGDKRTLDIQKECNKLDNTRPECELVASSITSKSITISVEAYFDGLTIIYK